MSAPRNSQSSDRPGTARRALLAGGAASLAAIAGSTLGRAQPASASTGPIDWINVVADFGAKNDGSADATTSIQNAVIAAGNTGGGEIVYFPAGTYKIVQGGINVPYNVRLVGCGSGTLIQLENNGTGTGSNLLRIFRMANTTPNTPPYPTNIFSGGVEDMVIDGGGMLTSGNYGNYAVGLSIGDGSDYYLNRVRFSNFNGTGSIGLHLDNQQGWCEKMTAAVQLFNCTTAVQIDQNGGMNSFMYNDLDFHLNLRPGQNGIVLQKGAFIANARLKARGNFYTQQGFTGSAGIALTIQGNDGASPPNYSYIGRTFFDVAVETDYGNSPLPQTISFGSVNNTLAGTGQLIFTDGWSPATVAGTPFSAGASQQFAFSGWIAGDAGLSGIAAAPPGSVQITSGAPVVYAANVLDTSGNLWDNSGDFFQLTLAKSITVHLGTGGGSVRGPQRKTIIISQPSSGGTYNYKVTWPSAVKWPAGTAPAMSTGQGATDMYNLVTIDGVTWIGTAAQNVS